MNKFKVGQRVKIKSTGNIGKILKVHSTDISSIGYSNHCYVIEVGCCCYDFTVHDLEEVKEILDAEEKEYLGNVIKPFRDRVTKIKKFEDSRDRQKEYITIYIKDDHAIILPNFKKNTMYQKMKIGKVYTLEELGL